MSYVYNPFTKNLDLVGSGGGGSGNVVGPGSSTDRAIATFNGTTGQLLFDNPSVTISSAGNILVQTSVAAETSILVKNSAVSSSADAAFMAETSNGNAFSRYSVSPSSSYSVGQASSSGNLNITYGANLTVTPASGANLWAMNNTGARRMGGQPAFRASLTATQSNVTGDGTSYDIIFDNPTLNQGSAYNSGTGAFTTPIDGAYLFIATVAFNGLGVAHTDLLVTLFSGGNPYYLAQCNPSTSNTSGNMIFSGSFIVNSVATSTTFIEVVVVGGTKVVGITGQNTGNYSNFSGCLLF